MKSPISSVLWFWSLSSFFRIRKSASTYRMFFAQGSSRYFSLSPSLKKRLNMAALSTTFFLDSSFLGMRVFQKEKKGIHALLFQQSSQKSVLEKLVLSRKRQE